jgi:NTE family protein
MGFRSGLLALALALLSACSTAPVQRLPGPPPPSAGPVAPIKNPNTPKLAVVLGGGGARGFAHVGVIKVLDAHGIRPDLIVGTSAGSAVGALYAYGLSGLELQTLALPLQRNTMLTWVLPNMGFASGEPLQQFVNSQLKQTPIEKLPTPFAAVATDLKTGRPVVFQRGNTGQAVRASCAVPGLFQPVRVGRRSFVDGGLVAPVPVSVAKDLGATFVIAVDITNKPNQNLTDSVTKIMLQTFDIMSEAINRYELKGADVLIQPMTKEINQIDLSDKDLAIIEGEKATTLAIPELLSKLKAAGFALHAPSSAANNSAAASAPAPSASLTRR